MELYHDVRSNDVLELRQSVESKEFYLAGKRIFDIITSSVLLVFFSPLLLFVAIIIKTTSKGPVIFKQKRVGQFGKEFVMYKFRTMTDYNYNPDGLKYLELIKKGCFVKTKNDPRVTRFGKYLRQTSLDELPQLFNVLKGDMSMVGPRPSELSLSGNEIIKYARTVVKPGITGLWQIKNRHNSTINDMITYDKIGRAHV